MAEATKRKDKRLPSHERRKVILEAARFTFQEKGYHDAHMELIASRANVTKPILYRHFPSKLKLLVAVIDQVGENLIAAISEPLGEDMDWRASIQHDIRAYLDFIEKYGAGYILLYSVGLSLDQEVSEHINMIRKAIVRVLKERITYFTDTNRVSAEEIELTAAMLAGMVEHAALFWLGEKKISRRTCEENLVRAVTGVLAGLPPRPR